MVAELDDPNIRKKLKQKHSVHDKLDKEGKLKQIEKLKSDVYEMLENMRAPDGRTLMEIYK
jgi:predicted house-cleaning noncanonical NTP pyrophosphatase (MazG superfamily)